MNKRKTAGLLCALLLLTGSAGAGISQMESEKTADTQELPESSQELTESTQAAETQTSEATEAAGTEAAPAVQTVTVTAVGDCTLGAAQTHGYAGSFHEYYDKYGENYFFDGVRDLFEQDDFTLVNLECVLSDSNDRVEKTWNLKGKPEYVGIMTGSSVEGCSLGNNHTFDYGQSGLDETREVLGEAGIIFGFNEHVATYTTDSGIVIGIVSANQLAADETHANYIRDGIEELRGEGADLVIASCHWGIEGDHYPNDYQQKLAHQVVDWGADLVVGTHPHVLQGVEEYKGKIILYSLGNFCFGGNRNPEDKNTAVYQQTFTFVDGVLQNDISADIIPCTISSADSRNDFQPTVATGDQKQSIIDRMNEYAEPYSDVCFDNTGKLSVQDGED
jgi:poly-gamma-glutamate synthesis protein (capsule biosynthesis protein)